MNKRQGGHSNFLNQNNFPHLVYKISRNMTKNIYENFGKWTAKQGIQDDRSTRIISRRRKNLQGQLLGVSMVILFNDSLNHLSDYRYVYKSVIKDRIRNRIYLISQSKDTEKSIQ